MTNRLRMINELVFQLNSKEVREHHDPVQLSVTDAKIILELLMLGAPKHQETITPCSNCLYATSANKRNEVEVG